MKYSVILGRELDAGLCERWSAIAERHPRYFSPYFRPEFARAVSAARDDLRVGILEDGNQVAGFFPFHRRAGGIARPAGLGLSDHHGVVVENEAEWDAGQLLRCCGLVRWEFDHLLAEQDEWARYRSGVTPSPIISTSRGFDHYEKVRRQLDGKQLRETYRRIRKLEREHEPHRFEVNTYSPDAFAAMINWKREQCQRTGVQDYFRLAWTVELVKLIHAYQSDAFSGLLSALYVGDSLVAVHFGMRSRHVWHSWFPGYDQRFHQYSPGLILLVEMIRHACESGMDYIDLGKDVPIYKEKFMTDEIMVAQGCAAVPSVVNRFIDLRKKSEQWGKRSVLRPLLRVPGKLIKRIVRRGRYE